MTFTSAMVLGNTRKAWVDGARGNTTPGKWFWIGNPIEGSGWGVIAPGSITSVTLKTKQTPTDRGGHESQLKQNRKQARQRAVANTPCHQTEEHQHAKQTQAHETRHCSKRTGVHYLKGNRPAIGAGNAQPPQQITWLKKIAGQPTHQDSMTWTILSQHANLATHRAVLDTET